jgi:hypothetical protein
MPLTAREFQRAAYQRLEVADFLIENVFTKDGKYLAGYGIECALKALILHHTPQSDQLTVFVKISSSASMHYPETLGQMLRDRCKIRIPLDLVKKFRRFQWSTSLRYETGRTPIGEARGLWKTAKATLNWVESN